MTSQDPREDGLYQRAQTRETPLLSKLADLTDAEWDELTHRMRKHFERALSERGYTIVASDRLAERAAWIEGWMQGAGQMTTWPPEALRSEAMRQYERRAALSRSEATEKGPVHAHDYGAAKIPCSQDHTATEKGAPRE